MQTTKNVIEFPVNLSSVLLERSHPLLYLKTHTLSPFPRKNAETTEVIRYFISIHPYFLFLLFACCSCVCTSDKLLQSAVTKSNALMLL